ncbi:hypothetical protein PanWU01x14_067050 [Parasponia andersonii]|uniref:Uncharacterized protein n=1 Tax=Parasponia andersonii TaxID=3476 RepID=A0A2P5DG70_PARAD|nr:hypothetical protein PanWU01x14_067050 [Parasponia andersonii]
MYSDAFLNAHFEVPGEMFSLAMEAKRRGIGGSRSKKNLPMIYGLNCPVWLVVGVGGGVKP